MSPAATRITRSTAASGKRKGRPALRTRSPVKVAMVAGTIILTVVPCSGRVSMMQRPPSLSTCSRAIVMPRPRPDTSVMTGLVVSPER
jgi:hypothetical protein